MTKLRSGALTALLCALAAATIDAKPALSEMMLDNRSFVSAVPFLLLDPPIGGATAPSPTARASYLTGSAIAALPEGALVIDEDSGKLVRTGDWGASEASLAIGSGASQLVVDPKAQLAYVVDRAGDQVVVVEIGKETELVKQGAYATHAEPYGIALTPDRRTLLVTTVADQQLSAYDSVSGKEQWSIDIGPEPRGVSVSPDGATALVASLTSGAVARVDLATRDVEHIPINPGHNTNSNNFGLAMPAGQLESTPGRGFARNAFSAQFVGNQLAIVPHQISTPHQAEGAENAGGYGGGFSPPITHRIAVIGPRGAADLASVQIGAHQPRAAVYDLKKDRLYVAGYGSDDLYVIGDVSQASIHLALQTSLTSDGSACGPTGLAIAADGRVMAFCSLTRTLSFVVEHEETGVPSITMSAELAPSRLSETELAGRTLFRQGGNPSLSAGGALACESCHPEGRTDGLSWRIEGHVLQTPLLAGRVVGTHPFKWDGGDKDLPTSLANTVIRLGGAALTEIQSQQLAAYVESLDRPRAPTPTSRKAIARGKALFESNELGCTSCHAGPSFTDGNQYPLANDFAQSDTPSLIGLANSAPYYHDGSAATLRALLMENGSIHGMGKVEALETKQIDDLIAFLDTL